MRVLIMAAGVGSRFGGTSKGFLEINGTPIIERMIKQLREYGLGPIYIVTGHKSEKFCNLRNVLLIPNPDYLRGDNAQGLKIAVDIIGFEDTLILDADLVLSEGALLPLLESYEKFKDPVSLADMSFDDDEAMKLVIKDERIVEYSKEHGKGAEICTLVTKDVLESIYEDLDRIRWWGVGVGEGKLRPRVACLEEGSSWIEIDTPEDYEIANALFQDK